MTWVPDAPPPAVAWSREPSPDDAWAPVQPPSGLWRVEANALLRFTEDGRLRITEDGQNFRVIEYSVVQWTREPPPSNPWS